MLLSVDWDAFSGTRELVFDAPIWGTPDREHDRLEAWKTRATKRRTAAHTAEWDALEEDFPLYPGWQSLQQYAGVPTWLALSHAEAWTWLDFFEVQDVLNIDSHADLGNLRGDPERIRPGNWAGLALAANRIKHYTCQYPAWHATLPVAEGYDLARTQQELAERLPDELMQRVSLSRAAAQSQPDWPAAGQVSGMLLVQSPAWTNPAHDAALWQLAQLLEARQLTPCQQRLSRPFPQ